MRRRAAAGALALALVGLVAIACSGGADEGLQPATLDAAEIVDALRPSLVYVETDLATGSGFVVEGGYVITNAHVVDPFGIVTVTPVDGRPEDVPVVGVDAFADIAVLGPLDQGAPRLPLATTIDVGVGEEVYLVGFPGDEPGTPEPTIAAGIVSRQRTLEEFDLTYIQTDAAIAGGQSGGAMVDDRGAVVGVSTLSYAEEFALALAAPDVARARDAILAGAGSFRAALPDGPLVSDVTFALPHRYDPGVVVFPAVPEERTITLDLTSDADLADVTLQAGDLLFGPLVLNEAARAEELAVDPYLVAEDLPDVTDPIAPGRWELVLPPDAIGLAAVGVRADAASVELTSSEPFVVVPFDLADRPLELGEPVRATLEWLDPPHSYVVELAEGDEIDLRAASPAGDMVLRIIAPGQWLGEAEEFDDSPGGLYGVDAEGRFTADTSGPHRIVVDAWDGVAVGYELEVSAP